MACSSKIGILCHDVKQDWEWPIIARERRVTGYAYDRQKWRNGCAHFKPIGKAVRAASIAEECVLERENNGCARYPCRRPAQPEVLRHLRRQRNYRAC